MARLSSRYEARSAPQARQTIAPAVGIAQSQTVLWVVPIAILSDCRAPGEEFSDEEWRLVSELADYPNRLLVTVTTETGETYAGVAHEAIFRRWYKLREWIAAEREFLAWRSGLEAARRAWQATPDRSKNDALLMGLALAQAQSWFTKRSEDLAAEDGNFIVLSRKVAKLQRRRIQALVGVLAFGVAATALGWLNNAYLAEQWRWWWTDRPFLAANIWPYVLNTEAEKALKPDPNKNFRECAPKQPDKDYCPDMVVVPAGSFMMGSPPSENVSITERPQHTVTIAKPFAVSKYELTFDEWDTCVSYGDCPQGISDSGFGRGRQPVINVTWDDAQRYVVWLSKMTGQPYRLLTEVEWEYAARAGTTTAYYWGNEIGTGKANCVGCDSQWDRKGTAPVGSFAANPFGLYDMAGNVWQWLQNCNNRNYNGAPTDGSAWISGDCSRRVSRGGSWVFGPQRLRSAHRAMDASGYRAYGTGFRVGRTLSP